MEVREGKRKEAVEKILEIIEVKVKIKEIKNIRGEAVRRKKMILVKLGDKEQRREVLRKSNLKGRKERIVEDWTWMERRMN